MKLPEEWKDAVNKTNTSVSRKKAKWDALSLYNVEKMRGIDQTSILYDEYGIDSATNLIKKSTLKELVKNLIKTVNDNLVIVDETDIYASCLVSYSNMDILPKMIRLSFTCSSCLSDESAHSECRVIMDIHQSGSATAKCCSSKHFTFATKEPSQQPMYNKRLDVKDSPSLPFLLYFWGVRRWVTTFSRHFAYITKTTESGKHILFKYYQKGMPYFEFYAQHTMKDRYAQCRAYQLAEDELMDETIEEHGHQPIISVETLDNNNNTQNKSNNAQRYNWIVIDPFVAWFKSIKYRRNFDCIEYKPKPLHYEANNQSNSLLKIYRTNAYDNDQSADGSAFNLWLGFNLQPKKSENPCPKIRQHLLEVLVSGDRTDYFKLLLYLAWLVQYPDQQSQVVPVLTSSQGTGKSTLGLIMQKIFGRHSIQLVHKKHFGNNFNAHLLNKNIVILEEVLWENDRNGESVLKSWVTDHNQLIEPKGVNAFQIESYANYVIVSNHERCFPATVDNRRFWPLNISEHRIGDHAYFNELYSEIHGNGVAELLYYLLHINIPANWKPWEQLPKNNERTLNALLSSSNASELKWLLAKVEEGEWVYEYTPRNNMFNQKCSMPIINAKTPSVVAAKDVMDAFQSEKERNADLKKHSKIGPGDYKKLIQFFKEHLSEDLFKWGDNSTFSGKQRKSYGFAPMKDIRKFLESLWRTKLGSTNDEKTSIDDGDDDAEEDISIEEEEEEEGDARPLKKTRIAHDNLRNASHNYHSYQSLKNINDGNCNATVPVTYGQRTDMTSFPVDEQEMVDQVVIGNDIAETPNYLDYTPSNNNQ